MSILPASGRFVRVLQRRTDGPWYSLERPSVFLAGSRFSCVTGTGTRPCVHLPCQESSGCPMNATSVLLSLRADTQNNKKPSWSEDLILAHSWFCSVCLELAQGDAAKPIWDPLPTNEIGFVETSEVQDLTFPCTLLLVWLWLHTDLCAGLNWITVALQVVVYWFPVSTHFECELTFPLPKVPFERVW